MDYYERMRFSPYFLSFLLAGSLGAQEAPVVPEPVAKQSAMDASLFYQLLLGELTARGDEAAAAYALLLDAARKTNDPAVYKRAVQVALQARSGESALLAAKAWSQAHPTSREANRYVLQILIGLNRTTDTLEPLKKELSLTPIDERRELIWSIPAIYQRVRDQSAAVVVAQKVLTDQLSRPDVGATAWAALGRMWLGAGDKTAALNAASKGLSLNAQSEHAALLALSMMASDTPDAEHLVKMHLPNARPEFRMAYIKTLLGKQRETDAQAELQSIKSQAPDYADVWLIDGALALQNGQLEPAQQSLQRYLGLVDATAPAQQAPEVKRGRTQAFLALSQVSLQRKDFLQAERWLDKVDSPDDVLSAQLRRAAVIGQQGRVDEAISLVQSQIERSEIDARLKRSAEVQILRDQKLYLRARDTLKAMLTEHPDDYDLMYDLAMMHEKLDSLDEMETLLRALISARPQDPHAYNALGYSLADRNVRLPEAIELITQALALSPKDPFITDSLAWAHYRSGNLEEALRLLKAAFQDKPDAEIAAHLGEALWQAKQRQEAVEAFKAGLKLNPGNETLTDTIKRLRVPL